MGCSVGTPDRCNMSFFLTRWSKTFRRPVRAGALLSDVVLLAGRFGWTVLLVETVWFVDSIRVQSRRGLHETDPVQEASGPVSSL